MDTRHTGGPRRRDLEPGTHPGNVVRLLPLRDLIELTSDGRLEGVGLDHSDQFPEGRPLGLLLGQGLVRVEP